MSGRSGAWLRQLIAFAVLIAVWQGAAQAGWLNPLYMPAPLAVALTLIELFRTGTIWIHIIATFSAALGGLVIGIAVGALLGTAAALVPLVGELLEPVMIGLNAVPRVVLAPLFVIWFGIALASKIALAFILVAVVIFFTVFTGIRQVDRRLVERVVTLGGGWQALLTEVYIPSVTAFILGNLKVAVGFAFTGAVVGEFVAATKGLGYLLSFAQSSYNSALMIALVVLIMGFVLAIFGLTGMLERRLLRWRG
jgi:NitT/TauT family transport system permease protein